MGAKWKAIPVSEWPSILLKINYSNFAAGKITIYAKKF